MDATIYHGGNLGRARQAFGEPAAGWLDLSTGINRMPYSIDGLTSDDWTRLPGRDAEAELEEIAAYAYGMQDPGRIMAVPGTQAVIQALPRQMHGGKVAILGFSYQEHGSVWRSQGATVGIIETLDEASLADVDTLVVVNPNNPDGRIVSRDTLLAAGEIVTRRGGSVIVDEAFMDVIGQQDSVLPVMPEAGWMVLRSVGKTWGLAGLRLGFFAAPTEVVAQMRRFFGPWSVNGPALKIGARALADRAWLEATRTRLKSDCLALDAILATAGLTVIGGTPLFRLAQSSEAGPHFARLGRTGILVRPFPDRADWLRFGVPATDAERARLKQALLP